MKLPIVYYGNPILRQKTKQVETITPEILALIDDMMETMIAANGLGIAAPQIGKSLSIFITSPPIEDGKGGFTQAPPTVFINPKLTNPSPDGWVHSEACLSIPKVQGNVIRPNEIVVTWLDINGCEHTETFRGWPARVIFHENDHINGVLFIDRLTAAERRAIEPELRAIKKKYK